MNALYKNLLLFHTAPSLLVGEITTKDLMLIDQYWYRKFMSTPAMVPTYVNQMIEGPVIGWTWVVKKVIGLKERLGKKEDISNEVNSWHELSSIPLLTKQIVSDFEPQLTSQLKRLVQKATCNSFYEIDRHPTHFPIWKCNFIWDRNHRLHWTDIIPLEIAHLSIRMMKKFYTISGLDSKAYLEQCHKIANQLKQLKMVPKTGWTFPTDERRPRVYDLEDVPLIFRHIFEKATSGSNDNSIIEGLEYKLLKDTYCCIDDNLEETVTNYRFQGHQM